MENTFFTQKLTLEQQREILEELFDFHLYKEEGDGSFVVCDSEGDEFFGSNENLQFDLTTLKGIFKYHAFINKKDGEYSIKNQFKALLGL